MDVRNVKVSIRSKVPRYEQTNFSGIEQKKAMGDESIYDLYGITSDEYPILSTTPPRSVGSLKYENPIYYGMADKPYVIAGDEEGETFDFWQSGTSYDVGDRVLYCGNIYVCIQRYGASSDSAKAVPASNAVNWKLYDGNTFSYDGNFGVDITFRENGVYYHEGEWYICKKEHSYGGIGDTALWEKSVPDWRSKGGTIFDGRYHSRNTYHKGNVVYIYEGSTLKFYINIYEGNTKNTYVTNTSRWMYADIEIPIFNEDVTYNIGDRVSRVSLPRSEDDFYIKISNVDNPRDNTEMWMPYRCSALYYDGEHIDGIQLLPGKKVCSYLNGKICIFPDKIYYDVIDKKFGFMKGTYTGCYPYDGIYSEANVDGYFENDAFVDNRQLIWYMSDSKKLIEGATGGYDTLSLWWSSSSGKTPVSNHGNINLKDIFNDGDIIEIKMLSADSVDYTNLVSGYYIVREVGSYYLRFDSQTFAGINFGSSTEVVNHTTLYELGAMSLKKDVPDMDTLCVSQNRMWGAKDNTVYACALGNCLSWQSYTGLDTDAVAFDIGTPGNIISSYEYGNSPMFFKENEFYRVYGSTVSDYSLTRVAGVGVNSDSANSICEINSVLFFNSPDGVYAYSGGIPSIISDNFDGRITDCIASTDGFKYYAMATIGGKRRMYVYDANKRVWTSESGIDVIGYARHDNTLKCLDSSGYEYVISGYGDFGTVMDDICEEAYIEFNDFYGGGIGHKEISRIIIRASVNPRYNPLHIYIQYDSDGMWHRVGKMYNQNNYKRVMEFGFALRKCDHYRFKLVCQGEFTLYSIAREYIDNE